MNLFCLICYSALEKIILNGYLALGLMYFFTVGEDEVKAWTVQVGSLCLCALFLLSMLVRCYVCMYVGCSNILLLWLRCTVLDVLIVSS